MKKFKNTIIGLLLTVGMFLSCAEAADEDFGTTIIIKLTGIAMIAMVPVLAEKMNIIKNH